MTLDQINKAYEPIGTWAISQVLIEYDGPRAAILEEENGRLLFGYWLDKSDQGFDYYLLAPTNRQKIESLLNGRATVRESMEQPWLWLARTEDAEMPTGAILAATVQLDDIPEDCLPEHEVTLIRANAPVLGISAEAGHQELPGSVLGNTIEKVRNALRTFVVADTEAVGGRPTNALRGMYDLPIERLALGSFHVSFGLPDQQALDGHQQTTAAIESLKKAIEWVTAEDETSPYEYFGSKQQAQTALSALGHLVPTRVGDVDSLTVRGRDLGKAFVIRPEHRPRVRRYAQMDETILQETGYVGELDKDRWTFHLRQRDKDQDWYCRVLDWEANEDIRELLLEAFVDGNDVVVIGNQSSTNTIDVIAIGQSQSEVMHTAGA